MNIILEKGKKFLKYWKINVLWDICFNKCLFFDNMKKNLNIIYMYYSFK